MSTATPPSKKAEQKLTKYQNGIAGGVASCAAKTVFAPLQRVIVLMQLGEHHDKSAPQLVKDVIMKEGNVVKAFWRGNLSSLIARFPYSAIQLVCYDEIKRVIERYVHYDEREKHTTLIGSVKHFAQSLASKAGAGAIAATIAATVTYPIEVIRGRIMSGNPQFRYITTTAAAIYSEAPYGRNFYKGYNTMLVQRVPDILINFAVYESIKLRMETQGFGSNAAIFTGSSAAALTSIVFCYPFDVAKKRIAQAKTRMDGIEYKGTWDSLKFIYKSKGVRGLYVGGQLEAVRCVPQVCFMWWATEKMREQFREMNTPKL